MALGLVWFGVKDWFDDYERATEYISPTWITAGTVVLVDASLCTIRYAMLMQCGYHW